MSNLKLLREGKKMSQASLASVVGVSPQAVSKWERGESSPQWEQAPKLADALECSIDALFGRESAEPNTS